MTYTDESQSSPDSDTQPRDIRTQTHVLNISPDDPNAVVDSGAMMTTVPRRLGDCILLSVKVNKPQPQIPLIKVPLSFPVILKGKTIVLQTIGAVYTDFDK